MTEQNQIEEPEKKKERSFAWKATRIREARWICNMPLDVISKKTGYPPAKYLHMEGAISIAFASEELWNKTLDALQPFASWLLEERFTEELDILYQVAAAGSEFLDYSTDPKFAAKVHKLFGKAVNRYERGFRDFTGGTLSLWALGYESYSLRKAVLSDWLTLGPPILLLVALKLGCLSGLIELFKEATEEWTKHKKGIQAAKKYGVLSSGGHFHSIR